MSVLTAGRRYFASTPRRTFALYPLVVLAEAVARRGRSGPIRSWVGLLLLPVGYLLYALTGQYRQRLKAGGRGFASPPDRVLETGPYRYTRNPMYLGHLIFMAGLALGFRSWLAWLILLGNFPWFHARVLEDEARLLARFGASYASYCRRVRRWLPFVA